MKKALVIIIALLLALSLATVLFVVGLEWTRSNNSDDKEKTQETQKYQTDTQPTEKKKTEDAVKESTGIKEKDEEDAEEKEGVVLDEEKEEVTQSSEKWYRVRKSADDAKSQKGAFQSLDNAKALAKEYKDEGYKVFDGNNCIYVP